MKIRTIVGVLLILALVMGSTGVAAADGPDVNNGYANNVDEDDRRVDWIDPDGDGPLPLLPPKDGSCQD